MRVKKSKLAIHIRLLALINFLKINTLYLSKSTKSTSVNKINKCQQIQQVLILLKIESVKHKKNRKDRTFGFLTEAKLIIDK